MRVQDMPKNQYVRETIQGFERDNYPNQRIVQSGQTIQAVIDSITDADADNPYVVMVPPGLSTDVEEITLSQYIAIVGSGLQATILKAKYSAEATNLLTIAEKRTTLKGFRLKAAANNADVTLINITDLTYINISDIRLSATAGSPIEFNHPNISSKAVFLSNIYTSSCRGSAIKNSGVGYARIALDGGRLLTASGYPDAHGIDGAFIGSIANIQSYAVGGYHIYLVDSHAGMTIRDCHLENATGLIQIYLKDCTNVIIENCSMWSDSPRLMTNAVYMENCTNCEVRNSDVKVTNASTAVGFRAFKADADCEGCRFVNNYMPGTITGDREKYDVSSGNEITESIEEKLLTGTMVLNHWGVSYIESSGGAITGTLPDGTKIGQRKTIVMTDATASSTISVTHHETSDPEVGTFDAVGEVWILEWTGTAWVTIKATCTFV